MSSVNSARQVERRKDIFAEKIATKICRETPCADNPYIAEKVSLHGYDIFNLMDKCNYAQVLFLLFRGELPNKDEEDIFQKLIIALINPGPRHPAARAAMNAGVGKTDFAHILPIGLMMLGGEREGSLEVEQAMRTFRKSLKKDERMILQEPLPGFGKVYGGIDVYARSLLEELNRSPGAGPIINWCLDLTDKAASQNYGVLRVGVAAAAFCDLGFQPRVGAALFQLLAAPGVLAHGLEYSNKAVTTMPFVKDSDYEIQK